MSKGRRVFGILMIIVAVGLLFVWENWGKNMTNDRVPVLKKTVEKGTVVDKGMIDYVHMDCKEKYIEEEDIAKYVDKQTTCPVHRGVPLFPEYFAEPETEPDREKGRVIMTVTGQMVINSWGPVKRGDVILIYRGEKLIAQGRAAAVYQDQKKIDVATSEESVKNVAKALSEGGRLIIARG